MALGYDCMFSGLGAGCLSSTEVLRLQYNQYHCQLWRKIQLLHATFVLQFLVAPGSALQDRQGEVWGGGGVRFPSRHSGCELLTLASTSSTLDPVMVSVSLGGSFKLLFPSILPPAV